jgi:Mg/Co/Ni transporter MgtE
VKSNPLSLDFLSQKPARAAAIIQALSDQQAADYLTQIPIRTLVPVIDCMEHWPAARILECMPVEKNAAIVSRLDYQSAVAVLRLQGALRREQLLGDLSKQLVQALRRSLAYPDNTVGAWTDSAAPQFYATTNAGDCLTLLQKMPKAAGTSLVITDDQHTVIGLVSIDELLISPTQKSLGDIADRDVQPLDDQMSLTMARESAGWDRYPSLPVRANHGVYIGMLSRANLQEALRLQNPVSLTTAGSSLTINLSRAMLTTVAGMLPLFSFEILGMLTGKSSHDSER